LDTELMADRRSAWYQWVIESFDPRARGFLHEMLHQAPFAGAVEINRARLKTVRPSSSSRVQVREREFEFS